MLVLVPMQGTTHMSHRELLTLHCTNTARSIAELLSLKNLYFECMIYAPLLTMYFNQIL